MADEQIIEVVAKGGHLIWSCKDTILSRDMQVLKGSLLIKGRHLSNIFIVFSITVSIEIRKLSPIMIAAIIDQPAPRDLGKVVFILFHSSHQSLTSTLYPIRTPTLWLQSELKVHVFISLRRPVGLYTETKWHFSKFCPSSLLNSLRFIASTPGLVQMLGFFY
jgi:hypothetical protein